MKRGSAHNHGAFLTGSEKEGMMSDKEESTREESRSAQPMSDEECAKIVGGGLAKKDDTQSEITPTSEGETIEST